MSTSPIIFFITAILPYIALIILIDGILYRLYGWSRRPKAAATFTVYPASKGFTRALPKILGQIFLLSKLLREKKALWAGIWLFHLSLVMIIVSHYKVFFRYMWFWENLGVSADSFSLISDLFDGVTGVIMVTSLAFLFVRRFPKFLRKLSIPEDYLILLLILGAALSGIYIRFISTINLLELRRYFVSLISFTPSNLPTDPAFLIHYSLVLILMIYFPFGKLIHTIGAGLTQLLVRIGLK
ncbi:MAG: respiratory nitrate reductase subunit gamma [Candidatus Bathyarchaeota archaeon]|nr:respiratory nitrate reductase subunit gamma [Candidatus Bathyarchaeota archaeon]